MDDAKEAGGTVILSQGSPLWAAPSLDIRVTRSLCGERRRCHLPNAARAAAPDGIQQFLTSMRAVLRLPRLRLPVAGLARSRQITMRRKWSVRLQSCLCSV